MPEVVKSHAQNHVYVLLRPFQIKRFFSRAHPRSHAIEVLVLNAGIKGLGIHCARGWIGLGNLGEEDKKLAKEGIEFAKKVVREKKPQLLILDEISLALHCGLLETREVLDFLNKIPKKTDVVLTGRYAPKGLIERADFVNEVKDVKHPIARASTN